MLYAHQMNKAPFNRIKLGYVKNEFWNAKNNGQFKCGREYFRESAWGEIQQPRFI